MSTKQSPNFFTGLNELRAIAAFGVLVHHIELFKNRDQLASLFDYGIVKHFIGALGKNCVYLFFVLSGFLITYLLLKEKEKNHQVQIKKFYLRRIYRIWPLYYLIIFISFVIIPLINQQIPVYSSVNNYYSEIINDLANYSLTPLLLFLLFLPNFVLPLGYRVAGASQTWSIGVEEQFYLIWPHIVSKFNYRSLLYIFSAITIVLAGLKLLPIPVVQKFLNVLPFEFMAVGAIGAVIYLYHSEIISKYLNNTYAQVLSIVLILVLLFFKIFPQVIQNLGIGILFLILIIQATDNTNRYVIRNKLLDRFGIISYGIYMYHPFVMFLVFPVVNKFFSGSNIIIYNIALYISIPLITVTLSHISYQYFEKYFVNLKDKKFKTV